MNATTEEIEPVSEDEALRQEAISSLKQKRRFAENAVAYVTVNGILWVIWALSDRSVDGGIAVARLGHGHLGLRPLARRLEDVRLVAPQPASADLGDGRRAGDGAAPPRLNAEVCVVVGVSPARAPRARP